MPSDSGGRIVWVDTSYVGPDMSKQRSIQRDGCKSPAV
jgi:hypothetical protein